MAAEITLKEEISRERTLKELEAPVRYELKGKEKEFEEHVLMHIDLIVECLKLPKINNIRRQKMINADGMYIKPDIIIDHVDDSITVFEVKKINEKNPCTGTVNQMNAVGQLILYKNVIKSIEEKEVRVALIDNKIYRRTFYAFMENDLPITLIEFQKDRLFVPYNAWR